MSNYHVLKQTDLKHEVRVVFHFPVPAGTNEAGKNFSDCVKEDLAPEDSAVPNLVTDNPTEHGQILNGEVLEVQKTVEFNATLTVAQKRAVIEQEWTDTQALLKKENEYQWWGYAADVP